MTRQRQTFPSVGRGRRAVWGVLLVAVWAAGAPGEVRFKHHYIDDNGPEGEIFSNLIVGDLDTDGRPDVIVGRSRYGKGPRGLYWYRNTGRIDRWPAPRVLHAAAACGCGGALLDVDRDGWPDVVDGGWYRCPGNPVGGAEFVRKGGFLGGHDTEVADLDGDGRMEIIVHTQHDEPGVHVYKAPKDPSKPWEHIRALVLPSRPGAKRKTSGVHAAISPRGFGDLDGDGDVDIVFCGSWLENADGKARRWTEHKNIDFARVGKWGRAVRCWVVDMDKDGRMDFVQSECDMPTGRVAWFRNVRGDGSRWQMHPLPDDRTPGDFHSLAVADFDLDGDWDVYADEMEHLHVPAGREGKTCMIVWENLDGRGERWRKRVIVRGLGGHQADVADLDGDGDVDIVTRPYKPHHNANGGRMHVSVLENLARRPDATGRGSGLGPGSAATPAAPPPKPKPPPPSPTPRKLTKARRTQSPADGLVARWTFDELPGGTACLDRTRGHLDAGAIDVAGSAITLAAWLRVESFGGRSRDARIVSKATGEKEQDHYWMLSGWRVGDAVRLRFRLKAGGSTATLIARSGGLKTRAWTHAAAVYDGRTMRLYQDGRPVGSMPKTGRIDGNPSVSAWLGDNPPTAGSRPFHGLMDDVRIYRRALAAEEIAALAKRR